MSDPDDFSFNCSECGEFDCDSDHDEDPLITDEDDVSIWGYNGDCA